MPDNHILYIVSTPGTPLNQASMVYTGDGRPIRRIYLGRRRIWTAPRVSETSE